MSADSEVRSDIPRLRLALLVVAAGLVGLIVWFPATFVLRALPAPYACDSAGGTLWRGHCVMLRHAGVPVGTVAWRIHAAPALRARLVADLDWSLQDSRLGVTAELSAGRLRLRDLVGVADLPTLRAMPVWPPAVTDAWPPGEGRLRPAIREAELRGGGLTRLVGSLEADGLVTAGRERWALGDYRLEWREAVPPSGASPIGVLSDRGGPLEVQAQLTSTPTAPGGWRLTGSVRARDAAWRARLAVFGPADGAGRHALSIGG